MSKKCSSDCRTTWHAHHRVLLPRRRLTPVGMSGVRLVSFAHDTPSGGTSVRHWVLLIQILQGNGMASFL